MEYNVCILTKNDCHKANRFIAPKGIILHSTGANNPTLKRYVQPDDGILGLNKYNNDWNRPGINKCVHAFIGQDKNGKVRVYQTLPWNMRAWGCGSGPKGSYNDTHIQIEMCEDDLHNILYLDTVLEKAVELCAMLCHDYRINVHDIVSHHEAHLKGYASNHSDCDHWLYLHGYSMGWFRQQVSKVMTEIYEHVVIEDGYYKVKITANKLNVRATPSVLGKKITTVSKGEVYTITETVNGWGRLKSGIGWISLKYTGKC